MVQILNIPKIFLFLMTFCRSCLERPRYKFGLLVVPNSLLAWTKSSSNEHGVNQPVNHKYYNVQVFHYFTSVFILQNQSSISSAPTVPCFSRKYPV